MVGTPEAVRARFRSSPESLRRLMVVIGTRPEAIKLAPVILLAKRDPRRFDMRVVTTGQHREMLDQMLAEFGILPDHDLHIMTHDQDVGSVTAKALAGLCDLTKRLNPDCVIVQGDTASTLAGALAGAFHGVPVAHVEAGLRTYDRAAPFPEELNRCLTTQTAEYHFAPTETARDNLLREGIAEHRVWTTGNTSIDALQLTLRRLRAFGVATDPEPMNALLTVHRRENHGAPMERICRAVLELLDRFPDLKVVFPVHPSPVVRAMATRLLGGHPRAQLTEPMGYCDFVAAIARAHLILSDSGGLQEEAAALGKPLLVLRDTTERWEGIDHGTAKLVGSDRARIIEEASLLLTDRNEYRRMSSAKNPYGDGTASLQILEVLGRELPHRQRVAAE